MSKNSSITPQKVVFNSGANESFKFDSGTSYRFNFSDFRSSTVTGILQETDALKNKNFLSCSLDSTIFINVLFDSGDFLDTSVNRSEFRRCTLKGAHFNTCQVTDTTFSSCSMQWTNHNQTTFTRCRFIDCDFENILIKNCEFLECTFTGGATTNKLFESCILLDCRFDDLPLQTQTILENNGLSHSQFGNTIFRNARQRDTHDVFTLSNIHEAYNEGDGDHITDFNFSYFLTGMSDDTYTHLQRIVDEPDWLRGHISASLVTRTENFVSFIEHLYNHNQLIFLPILRLRDFFVSVTQLLEENTNFHQRHVLHSFQGIRLSLSRYVDDFLQRLQKEAQFPHAYVQLDARGDPDVGFFSNLLSHLTNAGVIKIESVRVRNSPLDILVSFAEGGAIWFLAATVLSTRLRYKYIDDGNRDNRLTHQTESDDKEKSVVRTEPAVLEKMHVKLGPLEEGGHEFGFQYLSVFSNGIAKSLHLSFSFKRAIAIHKHIISFRKSHKGTDDL